MINKDVDRRDKQVIDRWQIANRQIQIDDRRQRRDDKRWVIAAWMVDVHTHMEGEKWTAIWYDDRDKQELRRDRKRYWKVRIAKEWIDLKIAIMKTLRTMNKTKKKEK